MTTIDDWPDCPPGCTLSCCVPTQEQSAEVAEMLRKPMTFPIEDGSPF
jgi:hypothetical protein